jgi:3-isopropylmalate dehydrogenase
MNMARVAEEPLHVDRPRAAAGAGRVTTYKVAVIPGDGIGPEVIAAAQRVLEDAAVRYGFEFEWHAVVAGGQAIDSYGEAIRDEDLALCQSSDAVLLGAVGGPKWDVPSSPVRPEQALFRLRKTLGLFANLRPVAAEPALIDASPLRPERLRGVDMLIVRELTGGLYFGERQEDHATPTGRAALDTLPYTDAEIRRITKLAFELARGRRHHLTSVDKANVLATSRLWRSVVTELASDFPDVELDHRLVDSCAMQLVTQPADFDVIVTENLFGDILSDEASVLAGSLGMLPSASLGERRTDHGIFGLYEPVHGSAPDIAGRDLANPAAAMLSGAMMLRWSFGQVEAAAAIEDAVRSALVDGYRTGDLIGTADAAGTSVGLIRVGTSGFRDAVLEGMGVAVQAVDAGPSADADMELLV